ncbi:flagellar hook-length control protein FliK [Thalassovita mangrovi]|nr:flagellar hook-length control protein FliK [Thalassovita mangrovi]
MSGKAKPGTEGAADFAELLKGSQNINAVPGNVAEAKGKPAADDTAEAASNGSGITFYSDNENGEPGDGETAEAGEGESEALLPLSVLSGETGDDATAPTGLPSTIDQLTPVVAAKPDPAAVAAAVAAEGQVETAIPLPDASQGEIETATSLLLKGKAATASALAGTAQKADGAAAVAGAADAVTDATANAAKTAATALTGDTALSQAEGQSDAGKTALPGAGQAVTEAIAGQQLAPDAETKPALQLTESEAAARAKELAEQFAPGQKIENSDAGKAAGKASEAPGAAVAAAARMANGSLSETGEAGAETAVEATAPDTQAVKAAVQAALADAGRGQAANGQPAPLNGGDAQAAATDHVETGTDTTAPALDSVIDEALSLDGAASDTLEPDFMQQTVATAAAAAISAAQQAEAQASASAPQAGVVTVQAGEMGETVATATSSASNANAAARNLQMVDPDWPVNLTSMIRAAQEMGQSEIEIALQPEKLGKMTIKLDMRDSSNVAVNIVTETDAAARMLNDNQSRLADMMQKAGLDLTQHHASSGQSFQDQGGQGGQMSGNSGSGTDAWQNSSDEELSAQSMQAAPDKGIDIIA